MLIDRFDVRAHLDYIPENLPQTESTTNEELSREDRLTNYERYRIIVQNDFLGSKSWRFYMFSSLIITLQIPQSRYGVSYHRTAGCLFVSKFIVPFRGTYHKTITTGSGVFLPNFETAIINRED